MSPDPIIQFNDGRAYDRYMGVWSRQVGARFLEWLEPERDLRWLDVGCGNGAFTKLLVTHCAPSSVHGIDPSSAQIEYARTDAALAGVHLDVGDAMALPYANDAFDAAVMPLVIFFVPDPSRGVDEMVRVVRDGGSVSAYAWDMEHGGFPYALLQEEMRALGFHVPRPPSDSVSRLDRLEDEWMRAELHDIATTTITVSRVFESFNDYWTTVRGAPSVGRTLAEIDDERIGVFQTRMQRLLQADASGRIRCEARANAVKGFVR